MWDPRQSYATIYSNFSTLFYNNIYIRIPHLSALALNAHLEYRFRTHCSSPCYQCNEESLFTKPPWFLSLLFNSISLLIQIEEYNSINHENVFNCNRISQQNCLTERSVVKWIRELVGWLNIDYRFYFILFQNLDSEGDMRFWNESL